EKALDRLAKFNFERNGFTALNLALAGIRVLRIPKETAIDEPFEFNFGGEDARAAFPHLVVIAEAGSKATVVEEYASQETSLTNAAIQVFVEDNANLTHYRVQKESPRAFQYGVTEVTLGRGSSYTLTSINIGGALSRHDIDVRF